MIEEICIVSNFIMASGFGSSGGISYYNCSSTQVFPHNPSMNPSAIRRTYADGVLFLEETIAASLYFTFTDNGCSSANYTYSYYIYFDSNIPYEGSTYFQNKNLSIGCCDMETNYTLVQNVVASGPYVPISVRSDEPSFDGIPACFRPNYIVCTNIEKLELPLTINLKLGPIANKCFSSDLQTLIKKYTGENLIIKGFRSEIDLGRILSISIGSDINETSTKLIELNVPNSHERSASDMNSLGSSAKRDSVNTKYYFIKNESNYSQNSYLLRVISTNPQQIFNLSSGAGIRNIVHDLIVEESFDNKLYFYINMTFASNLRSPEKFYSFSNLKREVTNISDFYERIVLNGSDNIDYQLTEIYQ